MWKSSSYEVIGRAHLKNGQPCQDKTFRGAVNDKIVIALADGAGSASRSDLGARLAAETAAIFVAANFECLHQQTDAEDVKIQIYGHVLDALQKKALELGCRVADLASTLLLAAVGGEDFLVLHIGDGVVGYLQENHLKVASAPQNGEFANETFFTTSEGALGLMRVIKGQIGEIEGFFLLSDGAATSLYNPKAQVFAGALKEMLRANSSLGNEKATALIKQAFDHVIVKKTSDDCSIALLSKA